MEALTFCNRYFDGWIRRDAAAVLDSFAPGGSYRDPLTPGPIAGDALRGYMQRLWAAFPDLGFEIGPLHKVDERHVHVQWTMTGSNGGSLNGLPPTHAKVRVPGIDVIEVGADGIVSVTGHFDSAALPRQLGLDVVVQPRRSGPFEFGLGTVVRPGRATAPGALAVTELIATDDAAVQRVRETSRQIVAEALALPGFLSFTGSVAGRRMTTVSTWDSVESLRGAMASATHAQAMRAFIEGNDAEAGVTSIYTPLRVGPYYRRCAGCGRMKRLDSASSGACADCDRALEPAL